jgi:ATP-dependent RNA helicase SUPV3L1/SUV3
MVAAAWLASIQGDDLSMTVHRSMRDPLILSGRGVTAILGPTNTGKTHYAIERMVAHSSGIIGLPLRLLAREVYTRLCEKLGDRLVALVTGEEKISPPGARYTVCTVEAMPRKADVAFVAIDEIQLAADLERGHVFTDRLLHLRGRDETLLLGAGTMRGILERLLPGVNIVVRPRLSTLSYAGPRKITRLPPRSAIVAFSSDEVYAIAELIRRQRGGAAIVMGALSPRTRNAQVALYQSGDIDFLVATDAIGMGLNLDVDHVAFAQDKKFDGYQFRDLTPAEIGQIAGRAGRHLRDGSFGVTGRSAHFEDAVWARVEAHEFDPVKVLQWRSGVLEFGSLDALKRSLDLAPPVDGLTRALPAVDQRALDFLSRDPDIVTAAQGVKAVETLWEACKLPDYRQIAPAQHADIISALYLDLMRRGHVHEDYMAEQVKRSDRTDGDIDTLQHRIAQIRTWTYVSNRPGWLADQAHWQEKTREIENRLSDALHERLTNRFIDRRTSVLMKRLKENTMLDAQISPDGTVTVEGHHVGELDGFRFTAAASGDGPEAKAVRAAAQKVLALELEARAARLVASGNGDFALGSDGSLRWIGSVVARLTGADHVLKPRVVVLADEQLTGPARDSVQARLDRFVTFHLGETIKPLFDLDGAEQLLGVTRGIAFRLVENLGTIERRDVAEEIKTLDQDGRAALRRYGVRFGAYHIFIPALIKPAPAAITTLLWSLANDGFDKPGHGDIVSALAQGRTSVVTDPAVAPEFFRLAGFRILGKRAVRIDILERLADLIRPTTQWRSGQAKRPEGAYSQGRFFVTPAMMSILGANAEDMEEILKGLGYRHDNIDAAAFASEVEKLDAAAPVEADEAAAKVVVEIKARHVVKPGATEKPADASDESSVEATVEEAVAGEVVAETPVTDGADEAAEPAAPVQVWRLGRPKRERPPRVAHRGQPGVKTRDANGGNRDNGDGQPARQGRGLGRGGAKPGDEQHGKKQDGGKHRGPKRDSHGGPGKGKPGAPVHAAKPRREREPDPLSPFAKLAALKEAMKK